MRLVVSPRDIYSRWFKLVTWKSLEAEPLVTKVPSYN